MREEVLRHDCDRGSLSRSRRTPRGSPGRYVTSVLLSFSYTQYKTCVRVHGRKFTTFAFCSPWRFCRGGDSILANLSSGLTFGNSLKRICEPHVKKPALVS